MGVLGHGSLPRLPGSERGGDTMATHQRLRPDNRDCTHDRRKSSIQPDQKQTIVVAELNATSHLAPQHDQLMPNRGVLRLKSDLRPERQYASARKKHCSATIPRQSWSGQWTMRTQNLIMSIVVNVVFRLSDPESRIPALVSKDRCARFGKIEKRRSHHDADCMTTNVLSPDVAAAIPIESRRGTYRADFKRLPERIPRWIPPAASGIPVVSQHCRSSQ